MEDKKLQQELEEAQLRYNSLRGVNEDAAKKQLAVVKDILARMRKLHLWSL